MPIPLKKSRGLTIIELLVVIAVISVALAGLAGLGSFILKLNHHLKQNTIATFLAQEGLEASRAIKEENWTALSALTPDSPYHPVKTGSPQKWAFATGAETIDIFSRQISISQVYRDTNDDIATSGGTLDSETKKITALISWNEQGQNYQIALESYLANWKP